MLEGNKLHLYKGQQSTPTPVGIGRKGPAVYTPMLDRVREGGEGGVSGCYTNAEVGGGTAA